MRGGAHTRVVYCILVILTFLIALVVAASELSLMEPQPRPSVWPS